MILKFTKILAVTFVIGLFASQTCSAQTIKFPADTGKNLVKINLPSLAMKTINLQYERVISKKTTVGLGLRIMPKGSLPFSSAFDRVDDQLGSLELGNIAITPEIKFYMGKGAFHGFYIAPYLRYANYTASIDYEFMVNGITETIPLNGSLNTFTAGVLFGAQWRIANKIYLDWSIFGPQYGFSQGSLTGTKNLSAAEQQSLRDELNDIDLPVGKTTATVNSTGANLDLRGPWAGIRANIGIGYRF